MFQIYVVFPPNNMLKLNYINISLYAGNIYTSRFMIKWENA
jgi:hypothetical protein